MNAAGWIAITLAAIAWIALFYFFASGVKTWTEKETTLPVSPSQKAIDASPRRSPYREPAAMPIDAGPEDGSLAWDPLAEKLHVRVTEERVTVTKSSLLGPTNAPASERGLTAVYDSEGRLIRIEGYR